MDGLIDGVHMSLGVYAALRCSSHGAILVLIFVLYGNPPPDEAKILRQLLDGGRDPLFKPHVDRTSHEPS
jgi:hypothetical protein